MSIVKDLKLIKHRIYERNQFRKADKLLEKTFVLKSCYIGPFVGEFGHLLSHIVPFINYLYSNGIEVHYMGPEIHKVFFQNVSNECIVASYHDLRDFYTEVSPVCNDLIAPEDVLIETSKFIALAKSSNLPFWDLSEKKFYWLGFCSWMYERGCYKIPIFNTEATKKKQIAIFARNKGGKSSVRGDDWSFPNLISSILANTNYNIVVLGHPAFSHNIKASERISVVLTNDNERILSECINSDYIINQLSGTHYLGLYADTKVIFLMKGNNIDFTNLLKDLKYRLLLKGTVDIKVANSINMVIKILRNDI